MKAATIYARNGHEGTNYIVLLCGASSGAKSSLTKRNIHRYKKVHLNFHYFLHYLKH